MDIKNRLNSQLHKAYSEIGIPGPTLSVQLSDRADLADYQFNGALHKPSGSTGYNPRAFAEQLRDHLLPLCPFAEITIAGPGFINFKIHDGDLLTALGNDSALPAPAPLGSQNTVIVDYGGPNVAKPMHVGHLRSAIIGESIKRLYRFMGHTVLGDVHLGDWGTQIGMVLVALQELHPDWPYFNSHITSFSEVPPLTFDELQYIYPTISARCKVDPELAEQARLATVTLQQGHVGYRALWRHIVDLSIQDMAAHFKKLNVSFDQWFGESRYQDQIPDLLTELDHGHLTVRDQGALIMPLVSPPGFKEMPPLLLQKSDGGYLYATTDMATIRERVRTFEANTIVYVVDARQKLHFDQVFQGARQAKYPVDMHFVGFGTMNGPDNKPFKTRAGDAMRLEELIDLVIQEAQQKLEQGGIAQSLPANERQDIAQKVAIAALKFADLQHNPLQSYQFDLNKFLSFEGKTGPYLLYAVVRLTSILEKAGSLGRHVDTSLPLMPQERDLIVALLNARQYIEWAYEKRSPNILCDEAFDLAQKFSRFYQACPVLIEKDPKRRSLRLRLCHDARHVLLVFLDLLGIDVPERM